MKISRSTRPRISRDGLLVLTEPSGEGLACLLSSCDNPECECRNMWIQAVPFGSWVREVTTEAGTLRFRGTEKDVPEPSEDVIGLLINVDHGELTYQDEDRTPIDLRSLPRLTVLAQAIDADLLDQMGRLWLRQKGWLVEGTRLPDPDLSGWTPGDLVRWRDVYQIVRNDAYLLNGAEYGAEDMYCVNPECPCGKASVAFGGRRKYVGAVHVQLTSGKAELEPKSGKERLLRALWERYLSRHHGIGHLRQREVEMRKFGAETLYAPRPVSVRREGRKVGRNDPCPCGSGKKYKKCCLGKAAAVEAQRA